MWKLRLKTVALPRITQVGTSGADAKLAVALSFVLSPVVFSVGIASRAGVYLGERKTYLPDFRGGLN